jgi:hypothetical protein
VNFDRTAVSDSTNNPTTLASADFRTAAVR